MQVSAVDVSYDSVILSALFKPNINNNGTVFGGSSASTLASHHMVILLVRLETTVIQNPLVIQRNTMEYKLPVESEQGHTSARPMTANCNHN